MKDVLNDPVSNLQSDFQKLIEEMIHHRIYDVDKFGEEINFKEWIQREKIMFSMIRNINIRLIKLEKKK